MSFYLDWRRSIPHEMRQFVSMVVKWKLVFVLWDNVSLLTLHCQAIVSGTLKSNTGSVAQGHVIKSENHKSVWVQLMAWHLFSAKLYLNQWWSRSLMHISITSPQYVYIPSSIGDTSILTLNVYTLVLHASEYTELYFVHLYSVVEQSKFLENMYCFDNLLHFKSF